ncbi:SchA/CurD-like domain-containing protein [Actinacidiphila bryophytorum]|uniref:SchA/CurD-like domain-containing protein n=1 Tax=Actinacidiphila bryophytorum TaxID=1436133 RepID=UPI002176A204|nr:SchA/CurD-like domain-containing protein [Actinacidiphila bryophytorum]UWE09891.1 antibiotic biosynthesis monooxygenase [Actinacidiphila bryophytorum]
MTTLSGQPGTAGTAAGAQETEPARLRVVLLLDIQKGAQQRFLDAYELLRSQVASVPGHVSDQLCQSIEDPSQWLITSEWESSEPFLAWVDSPEHREMVKPMHACVNDTRSLRFDVLRETSVAGHTGTRAPRPERAGDGRVRHAITFTVRPGSEDKVAKLLADYASPSARVDSATRLCRTSLFMHGNRVVRAVEVSGNLVAALRHVAQQPEVRAVEEAINPYLEEERDLTDPEAARAFFTRAGLPAVHEAVAEADRTGQVRRYALHYPVRGGSGAAAARVLARSDELAAADPTGSLVRSTVFQRDDVVVRVIDLAGAADEDLALTTGTADRDLAAELARQLELPDAVGDLGDDKGRRQLLAHLEMTLVTDRHAQDA